MKHYRSVGGTCFDVANTIFLVLLTIVMLYPLVNVLAISFSSKSAIDAGLVTWHCTASTYRAINICSATRN